jgi:hypothetical protein
MARRIQNLKSSVPEIGFSGADRSYLVLRRLGLGNPCHLDAEGAQFRFVQIGPQSFAHQF